MPGTGTFEPAGEGDLAAIADLMNRAYRGRDAAKGWTSEEAYLEGDRTSTQALRADLAAKPHARLLKWIETGASALCGCVWLEPLDEDAWYLGSLATDPERQGGGQGRAMLDAAEAYAMAQGATKVRISVINVRGPLIAWYERRGYVRTGTIDPFPYGDDRFGRPLRDDLAFEILEKPLVAPGA